MITFDFVVFEEFTDLFYPYFKRLVLDLFWNFGILSSISEKRRKLLFKKSVEERFFKFYSFPLNTRSVFDKIKIFALFLLNFGIYFDDEEIIQSGESLDDEF
jgi:hypothetical protein